MNCDLCHNPVQLNKEEFVLEEHEIPRQPDVTLVDFLAHKVCWDAQNPTFQYINIPGYGGFNG